MDRLKVILVDDEMLVRKLIRMKLDAERLNVEIIGEYSNGASALEAVQELKPDIVISDICMPEVDGLSFSEKCTKITPDIKVIILTGYDHFEYARRGLKAGVFDYLLKPVQNEELNMAVQRAVDVISSEREQTKSQENLREELNSQLPALRNIYLNQIMVDDHTENEVESKLETYGVVVNRAAQIEFQLGILAALESITRPKLISSMKTEAEHFFQSDVYISVVQDSWGRIVVISDGADVSFAECLDILRQMIEKKYNCHIQLGISLSFAGWADIRKTYITALDDIQRQHGIAAEQVHMTGTQLELSGVSQAIRAGKVAEAGECIRTELYRFKQQQSELLTRQKASVIVQKLCVDTEFNQCSLSGAEELKLSRCREDIERWLCRMVMDMAMLRAMEQDSDKGDLLNRILEYMKLHMENTDLSMNLLSREFNVSSSYLSRLFKQFTGKTYGEVMSEYRLSRMLTLLPNTELRDRDIGEQIGIGDAHYLSIWFRKMTEHSVTEYRKMKQWK